MCGNSLKLAKIPRFGPKKPEIQLKLVLFLRKKPKFAYIFTKSRIFRVIFSCRSDFSCHFFHSKSANSGGPIFNEAAFI